MAELVSVVLAVLGVASLVAAAPVIKRAWQRGARWQAFAAQTIVSGGLLSQSSWATNPQVVRIVLICVFCLAILGGILGRRRTFGVDREQYAPVPAFAVLLLWAWLFLVNVVFMSEHESASAFLRVTSGIALLLFVIGQRRSPIQLHQFFSAALTSVSAIVFALPLLPSGFRECTDFKCSEIDAILTGPFSSGNYLGLAIAMCAAMALAVYSTSRRRLLLVLAFLLAGLYATSARTSLVAIGAALLLYAITWLLGRITGGKASKVGAGLLAVVVGVVPTVVGTVMVLTADTTTLSNRGRVWVLGREAVGDNKLTGIGIDSWSALQATGEVSYHFTHSEYLLLLFSGGVIALVAYALLLVRSAYLGAISSDSARRGMIVTLTFAVCGIAEVVWNPLAIDGLTWMVLCVLASAQLKDTDSPRRVVQQAESPDKRLLV